MSKQPTEPSPSPQTRQDRNEAYDRAAATHPGACGAHVIDATGACVPLPAKKANPPARQDRDV
jgi:hypothetical protein